MRVFKPKYKLAFFLLLFFMGGPKWVLACEPKVNLGGQISFCSGNSLTLNASYPSSVYFWSTGAVTPTITVTTSGTYWVSVTNSCGTTMDTIEVFVDTPIDPQLGKDTSFCSGSGLWLTPAYSPSYQYTWQDGTRDSVFYVNQPGTYHVTINNSCGVFRDTIQISEDLPANLNLGADVVRCSSGPATLDAGWQPSPIRWNNGTRGRYLTVHTDGKYWATISNACGKFTDTVEVYYSKGPSLNLGGTIPLCTGGSITLDPKAGTKPSYLWSTGAQTPTLTVSSPGVYWLRLTDACGVFYDTVNVVASGPAQVDLGADTILCDGHWLSLDAGFPGSTFLWSNGFRSQSITVNKAGDYWVAVNNGCGYRYDTISITAVYPPKDTIPDTLTICQNGTRTMNATDWGPGTSYTWDDNSQNQTRVIQSTGKYWVTSFNACGSYTDTFNVKYDFPYTFSLGPDTILCDTSLTLSLPFTPTPYDTIHWSNGIDDEPAIKVGSSAVYWVEVKNACGSFYDTIEVIFTRPPNTIKASTNNSICINQVEQLWVDYQPGTSYLWSTGDTTSTISITQAGVYWVVVENACGIYEDTVNIDMDYPINFDLGPNDTICEGQFKILNLSFAQADSIWWNIGSNDAVLLPDTAGLYVVELYNSCGKFTDSIRLTVNLLPDKLLKPVSFCHDTSVVLNVAQPQAKSYRWNTGAQTSSITVSQGGWYYVDITNDCATIRDSVFVLEQHYIPAIDLGKDTIFCEGLLVLDPGYFPGATYTWQGTLRKRTLNVFRSGTYFVEVKNSCNTQWDTINVLVTGPPKLSLGTEVRFCYTNTFTLDAHNPGCDYLWNTGAQTRTINVDTSGTYWCTISNRCGTLTDSVDVIVEFDLDELDLGPDTMICSGNTLTLHTGFPDLKTIWQDGSGNESFTVDQTGLYWVRVFNTCGRWDDSIFVEVRGVPEFDLGRDTGICAVNGELYLEGPEGMQQYLWSDGSQERSTTFKGPGEHWLTVFNGCFFYTDTIKADLEYPLVIDLGPDSSFCETESYTLDAGERRYPVLWEDGSFGRYRQVNESGTYIARVKNSCGNFYDTVQVAFHEILEPGLEDTLICRGDFAIADLSGLGYDFEWFDGSRQEKRRFYFEGIYPLTIYNKCGTFNREYDITVSNCDCPLFIPNSFTPNGDGLNDDFGVGHSCMLKDFRLEIFDRWGMLVFSTSDPEVRWDGTFNGSNLQSAVYSFKLYYEWNVYQLDRNTTRTGTITLLR